MFLFSSPDVTINNDIDINLPAPLSPVAQAVGSEIRVGRNFKLSGKKNKDQVFTVLDIRADSFQYGIKGPNGKFISTFSMSFAECGRVILLPDAPATSPSLVKPVLLTEADVHENQRFTIQDNEHEGAEFTVIHVRPHGFQYGVKVNDENTQLGFIKFSDAPAIKFL